MAGLEGKRIALLEARMSGELAAMVERHGAIACRAPAVREAPADVPAEIDIFVDALAAGRFAVIIFMTGVGATALLREAERRGCLEAVLGALRRATTVCRGPKPVAVLRKHNVQVSVTAAEPHTTTELLQAIEHVVLEGTTVALVHYGERNDTASDVLRARGAVLSEICLYEWRLPEDVAPLEQIVGDIVGGRIDALAITSQIQVRHMFQIADRLGQGRALVDALNTAVVVAAVGPVCAAALRSYGVVPRVQPAHPKMGPMLLALADYFELTR